MAVVILGPLLLLLVIIFRRLLYNTPIFIIFREKQINRTHIRPLQSPNVRIHLTNVRRLSVLWVLVSPSPFVRTHIPPNQRTSVRAYLHSGLARALTYLPLLSSPPKIGGAPILGPLKGPKILALPLHWPLKGQWMWKCTCHEHQPVPNAPSSYPLARPYGRCNSTCCCTFARALARALGPSGPMNGATHVSTPQRGWIRARHVIVTAVRPSQRKKRVKNAPPIPPKGGMGGALTGVHPPSGGVHPPRHVYSHVLTRNGPSPPPKGEGPITRSHVWIHVRTREGPPSGAFTCITISTISLQPPLRGS